MSTESQIQPRRILLVEDEECLRMLLKWMLYGAGFEVSEACNGVEGLCLMQQKKFDLVVTDISMPAKDGLTMIEDAMFLVPDVNFVVYTGLNLADASVQNRLNKKNIIKVLNKPMPVTPFVAAIEDALHKSRRHDAPSPIGNSTIKRSSSGRTLTKGGKSDENR